MLSLLPDGNVKAIDLVACATEIINDGCQSHPIASPFCCPGFLNDVERLQIRAESQPHSVRPWFTTGHFIEEAAGEV